MDDLFGEVVSPGTDTFWQSFTSLTDLTVSRKYLSDFSLIALSVSGSLMRLTVVVNDYSFSPHTSTEAWKVLTRSCPSLDARFCFNMVMWYCYYLCDTLVPGIPLVTLKFHWSNRNDWDDISLFIATLYRNSLRGMHFCFVDQTALPKKCMDTIIERCLLLEEISFTHRIDVPSLQSDIVKSVKSSFDRQPASRLNKLTMNGKEIELCTTLSKLRKNRSLL